MAKTVDERPLAAFALSSCWSGSIAKTILDLVEKRQWSCARLPHSKEEAKACASLTAELASLGENASTLEGKSPQSRAEAASPSSKR